MTKRTRTIFLLSMEAVIEAVGVVVAAAVLGFYG